MNLITYFTKINNKRTIIYLAYSILAVTYLLLNPHWKITWDPIEDVSDYIYLAENFWGVNHLEKFYKIDFSIEWRALLDGIQFRQIGVGTIYLIINAFLKSNTNIIGPIITKIFLSLSYAYLAGVVTFKKGWILGISSFIVLILTTLKYSLRDSVAPLSEIFIRIIFISIFALTIKYGSKLSRKFIIKMFFLCFSLTLFKIQWIFVGAIFALYIIVCLLIEKRYKEFFVYGFLFSLIPIINIGINKIGWDDYLPSKGRSLHVLWHRRGHESFLSMICSQKKYPNLNLASCKEKSIIENFHNLGSWANFIRREVAFGSIRIDNIEDFLDKLDDLSDIYLGHHPLEYFRSIKEFLHDYYSFRGINQHSIYKDFAVKYIPEEKLALLDKVTLGICVLGLFFGSTRFLALFVLFITIYPFSLRFFTIWDWRYLDPMAGLNIILAFIIIWEAIKFIRNFKFAVAEYE